MISCYNLVEVIFCIIFPPIAVAMETGCSCQLLLNVILTLLGWIPGMIHAFCVVTDFCQKEDFLNQNPQPTTSTQAPPPAPAAPPPPPTPASNAAVSDTPMIETGKV